jgi:peptide/nickel transport system permease protein
LLGYVLRRVTAIVVMLFAISIVTFLLFFAIPRDPARLTCGKVCTPQLIAQNRHTLGYDRSVPAQYGAFLKGLLVSRNFPDDPQLERTHPELITHCHAPCLGYSPSQQTTVNNVMGQAAPVTLSLTLGAFVLWIVFGVGFGILSALRRGKVLDKLLVGVSLIGYSFPTFFVGLILYDIVSVKYGLLPTPQYVSPAHDPLGWAAGMLAPWITLALAYLALYIRLTRAKMLDTMTEDYIRTARAKGLRAHRVTLKHGLRATLAPIVTIAALDIAGLLGATAITETVFNLNGIGSTVIAAVKDADLPIIVTGVLIAAAAVVVLNLVVDLLYGVIDPKVRYS